MSKNTATVDQPAVDTDETPDPFAVLDKATLAPKRVKRDEYMGEIPTKVAAFVERCAASGENATIPCSPEWQAEFTPIFAAAASRMGKTARITDARKPSTKVDGKTVQGDRIGMALSVGERRGQKPNGNGATDAAPVDETNAE